LKELDRRASRHKGFDLDAAYRAAAHVRALRLARGELPIGRNIGFTNRTIWAEYDVWAPIWGDVYDRTVRDAPAPGDAFRLGELAEPRIEPEIVFGLAKAPAASMDAAALLDCIEWVAHGFEIVQSIFPGWKFAAADTVAAFGLHGAFLIAPRRDQWLTTLTSFQIDLSCDGVIVYRVTRRTCSGGRSRHCGTWWNFSRAIRRSRRWPRAKLSRQERSRARSKSRQGRRGRPPCTALRSTGSACDGADAAGLWPSRHRDVIAPFGRVLALDRRFAISPVAGPASSKGLRSETMHFIERILPAANNPSCPMQ
jgi:hypothetical protein